MFLNFFGRVDDVGPSDQQFSDMVGLEREKFRERGSLENVF